MNKNFLNNIVISIAILMAIILISSSSMSITLNNLSDTTNFNLEIIEEI